MDTIETDVESREYSENQVSAIGGQRKREVEDDEPTENERGTHSDNPNGSRVSEPNARASDDEEHAATISTLL